MDEIVCTIAKGNLRITYVWLVGRLLAEGRAGFDEAPAEKRVVDINEAAQRAVRPE